MPVRPVASMQGYGTRFGQPQINTGYSGTPASHLGEDLMAKAGTGALAFANGVIAAVHTWTGSKSDPYGNYIDLKGEDGNTYRYAHLQSVNVKPGQRVAEGALLGAVGATGNATGPHLHFEVIGPNGQRQNPDPFIRSAAMADIPEDVSRRPGNPGSGSPPSPPGGSPPGGDDKRDARQRAEDYVKELDKALASVDPELTGRRNEILQMKQQALASLLAYDRSSTPAQRDAAAQDLDRQQAAASAAGIDLRSREIDVTAASNAANNATTQRGQDISAATSRYGTDVDAATSRANNADTNATQRYGYDLQAAQQAANLEWDKEQARILQAFNEKKLDWEGAVAAATEARGRLELQLTQQRNAIEAASVEAQQRGQDFSGAVTQRGQDIDAGVALRGQDVSQQNQRLQSGSSLLGQAMSTAGSIGNATGQTAVASLPFVAPRGTGQYNADLLAGRPATAPGPMAMPFDPLTIVQQAANAAYQQFAPAGQALIAQGNAPVAPFVAPGQIAAPPRVVPNVQQISMGQPMLRAGGGGGFVAP